MLYDPKWSQAVPVKAPDVYAIPTFIAWLEKQPAATEYDYRNCQGECLLGQYMAAHGVAWEPDGGPKPHPYCTFVDQTGWGTLAAETPHTFGAALARARKLPS